MKSNYKRKKIKNLVSQITSANMMLLEAVRVNPTPAAVIDNTATRTLESS